MLLVICEVNWGGAAPSMFLVWHTVVPSVKSLLQVSTRATHASRSVVIDSGLSVACLDQSSRRLGVRVAVPHRSGGSPVAARECELVVICEAGVPGPVPKRQRSVRLSRCVVALASTLLVLHTRCPLRKSINTHLAGLISHS